MIHNGKRVAYTRIPTRKLIYSVVEEEKGEMCGTMQTLYLKVRRILHVHSQILPDRLLSSHVVPLWVQDGVTLRVLQGGILM